MRISLDSAQDMKLLQHTDLSVLWSKEGDPGMSEGLNRMQDATRHLHQNRVGV